jgi:hypothetical protein
MGLAAANDRAIQQRMGNLRGTSFGGQLPSDRSDRKKTA